MYKIYNKGISVVEIIVASAIISMSMVAISIVYGNLVKLSIENTEKIQATFLLDEGVEAIKTMRNESWSNIASTTAGATYYFVWSNNTWRGTTTSALIDEKFIRTFVVNPVYRDSSTFNILSNTSGTLDPGTKKVDIATSWLYKGSTSTKSITMYIFNLYE